MSKATKLWTLAAVAACSLQNGQAGMAAETADIRPQLTTDTPFFLDAKAVEGSVLIASHRSHSSHYSSRGGYSSPRYSSPSY